MENHEREDYCAFPELVMAAMNSWFISPQNVYDTYSYIFFLPQMGFSWNCCFVACFSCIDCISDLPRWIHAFLRHFPQWPLVFPSVAEDRAMLTVRRCTRPRARLWAYLAVPSLHGAAELNAAGLTVKCQDSCGPRFRFFSKFMTYQWYCVDLDWHRRFRDLSQFFSRKTPRNDITGSWAIHVFNKLRTPCQICL